MSAREKNIVYSNTKYKKKNAIQHPRFFAVKKKEEKMNKEEEKTKTNGHHTKEKTTK